MQELLHLLLAEARDAEAVALSEGVLRTQPAGRDPRPRCHAQGPIFKVALGSTEEALEALRAVHPAAVDALP